MPNTTQHIHTRTKQQPALRLSLLSSQNAQVVNYVTQSRFHMQQTSHGNFKLKTNKTHHPKSQRPQPTIIKTKVKLTSLSCNHGRSQLRSTTVTWSFLPFDNLCVCMCYIWLNYFLYYMAKSFLFFEFIQLNPL